MDDNDIVELYWKRDERALRYSEKKYRAYCLKIADNILNNREDSEECVNDALLVAWNEIPPQRPGSFKMFLARITRNGAINRLKSYTAKKRHGGDADIAIEELSEIVAGGTDVEGEVIAEELKECIGQFVVGLSGEGYDVYSAYSGTEAELVQKTKNPDLILLDLMLPVITGEELITQIKNIPVIVISAKADTNDKVNLLLNGAEDYVTKPFDTEELLARIKVRLRTQGRSEGRFSD